MNKKIKLEAKVIPNTAHPWMASGPGWGNSGVTAMVRHYDSSGKMTEREETFYSEHFDGAVLKAAVVLCDALEQQFIKALNSSRGKRG